MGEVNFSFLSPIFSFYFFSSTEFPSGLPFFTWKRKTDKNKCCHFFFNQILPLFFSPTTFWRYPPSFCFSVFEISSPFVFQRFYFSLFFVQMFFTVPSPPMFFFLIFFYFFSHFFFLNFLLPPIFFSSNFTKFSTFFSKFFTLRAQPSLKVFNYI